MNILFHLHAYPNEVLAGAETMAHRIAKYLQSVGHSVKVYSQTAKEPRKFVDNIEVLRFESGTDDSENWKWADLVFTHLGATYYCLNKSRWYSKKLVHLIHNSFGDHLVSVRVKNNFLVYNSEYVKRVLKYEHPSCICIPPVDYREYQNVKPKGNYITLVNLNENKGGQILIELAKRLPQYQFLGVTGGYYDQIKEKLPNLKYIEPQSNIKVAYEQSKIVIMPSEYESYGQVAIEAISCGIPVISSKAQGLVEALSYAGTPIDRTDLNAWCEAIIKLMSDNEYYKRKSLESLKRAKELDPLNYLNGLNDFLTQIYKISWQE